MTRSQPALEAGDIFPDTARARGAHLEIGGCDVSELAQRFGTPLYVYDEASIVARAATYRETLASGYAGRSLVCYAAKAYCAPWLLRLVEREGLGLDVVSGGELHAAVAVGFPAERIYFHGNNKTEEELERALDAKVGRIVIDNLDELAMLARLATARGVRQPVLLRVGPDIAAHTHAHLQTGATDTKFGLGIASGQAAEGIRAALVRPSLDLRGIHAHIGSQIFDLATYGEAIGRLFALAASLRADGFDLRELSPGGGFGVRYTPDDPSLRTQDAIARIAALVAGAARRHGYERLPDLTIEPGRSLIASSAVALYRAGAVKRIPGGRTYVAVDGGMADNIRPTAYGAEYTAVVADRLDEPAEAEVAIAGRYCESGDILIQRVRLPLPRPGDLIAIPSAGAYQLSMASNYNMAPRPAVVVVADGKARLVRRRETYDDLLRGDDEGTPVSPT
ncbi:MAG TPA: diaminopimelate decarboxylase [Candidatus Limnocylindria bacterium]|nr:diaminopimelate decarboxylase [Candidatus Limnocylindria bacterium]